MMGKPVLLSKWKIENVGTGEERKMGYGALFSQKKKRGSKKERDRLSFVVMSVVHCNFFS